MKFDVIFTRLGYPKHTDVVYQVLTRSPKPLSIAAVAKTTKLPRMTVYRVIVPLCRDKIILKEAVGKRTLYKTAHPSVLEKIISNDVSETENIVSNLVTQYVNNIPSNIRFLSGQAGITAAFDDVVAHTPHGGTVYRYTSEKDLSEVNAYLAVDYRKRRDAKKLERLVISNPISGSQKRKRLERFIRFIPRDVDTFDQNIIQFVYGNRVSFIDITTEQVTIIENAQLAAFQKVIFTQLYKKLPRD